MSCEGGKRGGMRLCAFYVCIHVHLYVCMCMCSLTHVYVCPGIIACLCMYVCMRVHMCAYARDSMYGKLIDIHKE